MADIAGGRKRNAITDHESLAESYDTLRYVEASARRLVALAAPPAGAQVLDVATGTGWAAITAAECVGSTGRVLGVDLAPSLLARARKKAAKAGLTNIESQKGDATRLDLPDQLFDIVLCASALFFLPDMLAALREWRRVLKTGGQVGFSWWGPGHRQPLRDMRTARLQRFGVPPPAVSPNHGLAQPGTCWQLLREAGFVLVEVRSEQLGYYQTAEAYWAELLAGLAGPPVLQLEPALRERFKAEHLAEVEALATAEGIWMDVSANFSFGRRYP